MALAESFTSKLHRRTDRRTDRPTDNSGLLSRAFFLGTKLMHEKEKISRNGHTKRAKTLCLILIEYRYVPTAYILG